MQSKFESNILKNQLFSKQHSLLLAISGGVDSVVLAHLLKKAGFTFALAHCNFKLRGKDSEADEAFCKALAKKLDVKFYTQSFNTEAYRKKNNISIQMAARELRYNWFNEVLSKNKFDYLATAHHANDQIETIFINLCRGTGINGLKGIPQKTENIVRPLLNFTKEEISTFAKKEKIKYRTDESNLEAKYERNFLRLKVIPKLKELHPNIEQTFLNNVANFKEEAEIISDFLEHKTKQLLSKKAELLSLNKNLLKTEKQITTVLHYILEPFGFNHAQIADIKTNITENGEAGRLFYTSTHTLTIDRDFIFIKQNTSDNFKSTSIKSMSDLKKSKLFVIEKIKHFDKVKNNELVIEDEKLIFPLTVRTAKTGDKFKPFGMNGFKLLSDYFKDQKLNAFDKQNCQLLENGNKEIIWVIGYRSDDRYKISDKSKNLLKLSLVD
ncbi:MAG: tRNA lysidine(34) synthetase TilS [Bacteroidota bacterium]|nr:tRNA lysidine(34) synthetase TilS [Bacteroidota bacterium]MDP3144666.1 tRNA lysidine(34) synthetase TilS [Bacteroidota bacterium]